MRAWPEASTRMFGYRPLVREAARHVLVGTYSLQIPMNHSEKMEVLKTTCDIDQLMGN